MSTKAVAAAATSRTFTHRPGAQAGVRRKPEGQRVGWAFTWSEWQHAMRGAASDENSPAHGSCTHTGTGGGANVRPMPVRRVGAGRRAASKCQPVLRRHAALPSATVLCLSGSPPGRQNLWACAWFWMRISMRTRMRKMKTALSINVVCMSSCELCVPHRAVPLPARSGCAECADRGARCGCGLARCACFFNTRGLDTVTTV